jgi:hypothetical protein
MKNIIKLFKISILAGITVLFLLAGGPAEALGFQDMMCNSGPSADEGAKTCKTAEADQDGVKISCTTGASAENAFPVYLCFAVIRDWGQPSPYAHTSHTWRCRSGARETVLFAADFFQDPVRCDLVCGRCEAGWQAVP